MDSRHRPAAGDRVRLALGASQGAASPPIAGESMLLTLTGAAWAWSRPWIIQALLALMPARFLASCLGLEFAVLGFTMGLVSHRWFLASFPLR